MFKKCSKCQITLEVFNFYKHKSNKDGLSGKCKQCTSTHNKKNKSKRYNNYLNFLKQNKNYRQEYKAKKPQEHAKYYKKYKELNKQTLAKKAKDYKNNNLHRKISLALRNRLFSALKNNQKIGSAVQDLGCSVNEFKTYLESLFQPGMTWDNWSKDGWHIDHIKPLSSFDLTDRNELLEACHYTNLQPLWAKDNLRKSNRSNGK